MASAGGLYVEIIPTFVGGAERIFAEMVAPASEAGARAGQALSREVIANASGAGVEAGRNVATGFTEATAAAGVEAGRAISRGAIEGSSGSGAEIGRIINSEALAATSRTGAEIGGLIHREAVASASGTGAEIGSEIRTGVAAGAAEGSAAAAATLREGGAVAGSEAGTTSGSWFTRTFGAASAGAGDKLVAEMQARLKAASAGVVEAEAAVARAFNAEETAADKLNLAETRLLETKIRYAEGSGAVVAAENRVAAAQRDVEARANASVLASNNLSLARDKQVVATKEVEAAEARAVASSANMGNAVNALVPAAGRVSAEWGKMGALIGVTVAGYMAYEGVKSAGDYQQALVRLVTSAGETNQNLQIVGDGLLKMAGEVGFSAQDLAKGMYTVESAGFHGAEGLKVMRTAAEGAKAENADLGTSANAVTTILQDYHLGADQAATITSKLVAVTSDGKVSFQDLTGALHSVTPLAAAAGISFSDVGGALASMTSHGVSAEQASQNLAMAIRTFQNPSMQMRQELGNLGLSAEDLSQHLGQRGITGTMQMVSETILKRMGPDGKVLMDAFNQSKDAAAGMNEMLAKMPPEAKRVADGFNNGSINVKQLRQEIKSLSPENANLVTQFVTLHNRSEGFSNQLKRGGSDVQTYASEIQKVTGNSVTANVVMQTTGENFAYTAKAVRDASNAGAEYGNHVRGWHEIQQTFNQKLAEFKSAMGSIGIEIGQVLLPAVTHLMDGFLNLKKFVDDHITAFKILGGVVGTVVGAFSAMVIIQKVAGFISVITDATKIATAAQWAYNLAIEANPFVAVATAIIVAIGLLVAGFIYMYNHVQWFHDGVNALWNDVGTVFKWVWENVIKPVWDGFTSAIQWAWDNVLKPIWAFIQQAWNDLWSVIKTVWDNIGKPLWDVVAGAAQWLWDTILKPIFTYIGDHWDTIWKGIQKVWDDIGKPIFIAVGIIVGLVVAAVIVDFLLMVATFVAIVEGIKLAWEYILKPCWDALKDAAHAVWEKIQDVCNWIARKWDELMHGIDAAWQNYVKPAFDAIKGAVHSVGDAFDNAVNWIQQTWDRIKDITRTPVNFVIDVVYNRGIAPLWNKIADIFHLGKLDNVATLAGGGIMPGYSPGVDSIPAVLSPGEAVLVPEAVRAIGPANILAMNAHYSGGRPSGSTAGYSAGPRGFADGGIVDSIGGAISGVGGFIGGLASDAWKGIQDAMGWLMSIAGDVAGGVGKLFSPVTDAMGNMPMPYGSGGMFKDALNAIPKEVIDAVVSKVQGFMASMMSGGGMKVASSQAVQAWAPVVMQALGMLGLPADWLGITLARMQQESGGDPNIGNFWDSNAAAGHPSMGLMQVIGPTFDSYWDSRTPHNILDPLANIVASMRYTMATYGSLPAGYGRAGGYDEGGYLQPGYNQVVYNGTGKPEPVFTSAQWDILKQNINKNQGDGGGTTINVSHYSSGSPESLAHTIDRHLSRNTRLGVSF